MLSWITLLDVNRAVQFQNLPASGLLMKPVGILRDYRFQLACLLQPGQRQMRMVGLDD